MSAYLKSIRGFGLLAMLLTLLGFPIACAFLIRSYSEPSIRSGDLLRDIENASGIAWIGPHPDDEIFASGLLALASLHNKKDVYVVSLDNDPVSFPPGADKYDRFQDNEDLKKFLQLKEYVRWNINEIPPTMEKETTMTYLRDYTQQNNIDLLLTFENTNGYYGHPEHIVTSQWVTEFAQQENIKLYYVLNRDPFLTQIWQEWTMDPLPYSDKLDLDAFYVQSYLGNTSLWEIRIEVLEIYKTSVPIALEILNNPGYVANLTHEEYYINKYANVSFPVPTIESCNATGDKKDFFNLYEDVYLKGRDFLPSTTYDLYVVDDLGVWTDGMPIPSRVLGTANSIFSDSNGSLFPIVVWSGPSTLGEYDIVVDVNGNGFYDAGIDALDNDDVEVTAGFVIPEFKPLLILSLFMILTMLGFFPQKNQRSYRRPEVKLEDWVKDETETIIILQEMRALVHRSRNMANLIGNDKTIARVNSQQC